ncbi:MAG: hypothetical protein M3Y59_20080 [Myxococcota bacterium]|nr:hypothetical protein [Myxococcota bacterium]
MTKVALVSCRMLGGLDEQDAPLPAALAQVGLEAEVTFWDDPDVRWEQYALAVIRSPWDYFRRYPEFLAWLDRIEQATSLWNPPAFLRWNSHKRYLLGLEALGVPVVPTLLLTRGIPVSLAHAAGARGWEDVVLKPAVAAGAFRTLHHRDVNAPDAQQHLDALLKDVDVLLQPYQAQVSASREQSLIYIDGQLMQGLQKEAVFDIPADAPQIVAGAARARITPTQPTGEQRALAERALASVPVESLLYARVDMVRGEDGAMRLMELEAFDPSLYLKTFPHLARALAEAISRRVASTT